MRAKIVLAYLTITVDTIKKDDNGSETLNVKGHIKPTGCFKFAVLHYFNAKVTFTSNCSFIFLKSIFGSCSSPGAITASDFIILFA